MQLLGYSGWRGHIEGKTFVYDLPPDRYSQTEVWIEGSFDSVFCRSKLTLSLTKTTHVSCSQITGRVRGLVLQGQEVPEIARFQR